MSTRIVRTLSVTLLRAANSHENRGAKPMAKKILAVDDERHIVRLVQVNLERAGYEVVTAFDGKDALEKVELENPDLVVLDVMMPYMDGFEVLQNLRKNPATRELPVIMLTAKAQDADVFRGWQSGVDCYLTKPFNPMELISFVKRIFSSQDGSDGEGNGRYTIG
jgi:two-component system alkaline phosphatase synthesis response regulator PhoP